MSANKKQKQEQGIQSTPTGYVSAVEAAKELGIKPRSVRSAVDRNSLVAIKLGKRDRRCLYAISRESLEAYKKTNRAEVPSGFYTTVEAAAKLRDVGITIAALRCMITRGEVEVTPHPFRNNQVRYLLAESELDYVRERVRARVVPRRRSGTDDR